MICSIRPPTPEKKRGPYTRQPNLNSELKRSPLHAHAPASLHARHLLPFPSPPAPSPHGLRRVLQLQSFRGYPGRRRRLGEARYRSCSTQPILYGSFFSSPWVPSTARFLILSDFLVRPVHSFPVPADSAHPEVAVAEDDAVVCSLVAPAAAGGEELAWCEIRRGGDASSATIRNLRYDPWLLLWGAGSLMECALLGMCGFWCGFKALFWCCVL